MIYAIAKIGSKQYKITENQELTVDSLSQKTGSVVGVEDIVLVGQGDTRLIGEDAKVAKIKAKVIEELKGDKVLVFKYKKRKRYRRLKGHRQSLTKIKIESIDFPGKKEELKPKVSAKKKGDEQAKEKEKSADLKPKGKSQKESEQLTKTPKAEVKKSTVDAKIDTKASKKETTSINKKEAKSSSKKDSKTPENKDSSNSSI